MSKFFQMSAEELAQLQAIVGDVDVENGLTPMQQSMLASHELQDVVKEVLASPAGEHAMLPELIKNKHFLFTLDGLDSEGAAAHFVRQYSMISTQAYKVFLFGDSTLDFLNFSLNNKPKAFAGPTLNLKYPTANTWFEVVFPEGRRPFIPPVGENIKTDQMRLRVNRIAIHANCDGCIMPLPIETDDPMVAEIMAQPTFRKEASVMFFVDVEGYGIHTYGGLIQYGYGGAKVFKAYDALQAAYAFQGEPPTVLGHARMANFAQFGCGTLAQLLSYFADKGTMEFEALRAYHRFEGQTGFSDDVSLFATAEGETV